MPNLVFGYDKIPGDYFNLAINGQEALVIKQIYDLYVNYGCGAAKIANVLNENGVKTKRNCRWSQNAVCRILTNELYTGKVINGKEEVEDFLTGKRAERDETECIVTEKPELKIIEPELYEQVRQIMSDRNKHFKTDNVKQSNKHLFSTLIKCKECGWSFRQSVRKYKNTYIKWVCSGHNGKGVDSCPNAVTVDENELIEVLQNYFAELLANRKNVVKYVVNEFRRVYKAKDENISYEKELKAKIAKLENTRQKYIDLYTDDIITRAEMNKKIVGCKKELERLQNELKMVSYHLTKEEQREDISNNTFKEIADITDVRNMTNAQLKKSFRK